MTYQTRLKHTITALAVFLIVGLSAVCATTSPAAPTSDSASAEPTTAQLDQSVEPVSSVKTAPTAAPATPGKPDGGPGVLTTPELVELLTPSVVQIAVSLDRGQGVGTGVIFDSDGHILTNWHVVEGARTITVAFEDGSVVKGELFRRDPQLDLAIVRVDQKNVRPAMFGDSGTLRVGEDVVAIGHALGLRGGPTVSKGVVSALDRTIVGESGGNLTGLVQTDAAINEGNSGGPLLNMRGEVIGINTAKINVGDRLGFAININAAKAAAEQLIAQGPVPPPGFLGVGGVDVTRALAFALGLPVAQGFGVTVIEPGSPADIAGVKLDDIIVRLNNVEVIDGQDLTDFLREKPSGSEITITVVRNSRFLVTLEATLTARPGE
ncbi:MAG: trypsin-like peptidase domain-containing protein [Chloroflexi bacterium]|nr:trypsin-like peptidase domain-containing protein [Chloroflexota bacterium]